MMNAGSIMQTNIDDLTERVEIIYNPTTQDSAGNLIHGEEASRGECWAKVLPLSAKSAEAYNETENAVLYRVIVRYRTDIQPTDRVSWRGKVLKLIAPAYDAESRKIWTVCDCKEVVENA